MQTLSVTLRLAAVTTAILLLLAIPLAFWIVSTRSRLRPLVEAVTTLPLYYHPPFWVSIFSSCSERAPR